jgi:hypothetical protein
MRESHAVKSTSSTRTAAALGFVSESVEQNQTNSGTVSPMKFGLGRLDPDADPISL